MKDKKKGKKELIKKETINVIFLDLRKSTKLNKIFDPKKMFTIYSKFLNNSYKILKLNGYKNIDIQGDGIYGIIKWDQYRKIENCLNSLEQLIDDLKKNNNIEITMAIFSGKECSSYFGSTNKKEKQIAYFNGLVSMSKKIISNSSNDTKIIINEKTKVDLEKNTNLNLTKKYLNHSIRGREYAGKFWLKKR